MMKMMGIDLKVTARKEEILGTLRANREQHQKMVAEARLGYIDAAQTALRGKLAALEKGQPVALDFKLRPPKDFSRIYDTTIKQLEAHTGSVIELSSSEFNMLVEDEWEWMREFINLNAQYSGSTRTFGATKGFEVE